MTLISQNKKALWNYEIIKTLNAGIVLKGSEVKSIRERNINIADAFAKMIKGEIYLINAHISLFKTNSSLFTHEPTRSRKLLLHKKEIQMFVSKMKEKGFALIPLKVFITEKNLIKIEIGLAKGKKSFDKRATLKEKEIKRDLSKEMKNWNLKKNA